MPPAGAAAAAGLPTTAAISSSRLQEQELRQTQGHHLLKCEVWDALALANQRLGAVGAEADALAAGLKACRQGAASKDRWGAQGEGVQMLGRGCCATGGHLWEQPPSAGM